MTNSLTYSIWVIIVIALQISAINIIIIPNLVLDTDGYGTLSALNILKYIAIAATMLVGALGFSVLVGTIKATVGISNPFSNPAPSVVIAFIIETIILICRVRMKRKRLMYEKRGDEQWEKIDS